MNPTLWSRFTRPFALAALVCLSVPSLAQSEAGEAETPASPPSAAIQAGTFGFSASLFGGGSGSVGALYFLGPSSALHLNFSTALGIRPATFAFGLGVGYRMYMAKAGQVSLFVEPGAHVGFNNSTNLSFNVGAGVGLEYFIAERLSVGMEANLSLRTNNRFDVVLIDTSMSSIFLSLFF